MIIIFSIPEDTSTVRVIKWLEYYNESYFVIQPRDILKISINGSTISFAGKTIIDTSLITSVWFRRWSSWKPIENEKTSFDISINNNISVYEFKGISDYLFSLFDNANWLNHPSKIEINKLLQLDKAKKHKINIPSFTIISGKNDLIRHADGKELIVKPVSRPINSNTLAIYTSELNKEDIESTKDFFFPSLVQQKIIALYEIRTFFIDNQFYSMAILNNDKKRVSVDSRKNMALGKCSYYPYSLPKEFTRKLLQLMGDLGLNSGSIDLLKGEDNIYYYLEVNPVGQFQFLSDKCNFQIEKIIAKRLINGK